LYIINGGRLAQITALNAPLPTCVALKMLFSVSWVSLRDVPVDGAAQPFALLFLVFRITNTKLDAPKGCLEEAAGLSARRQFLRGVFRRAGETAVADDIMRGLRLIPAPVRELAMASALLPPRERNLSTWG
jgi:hypothetical protein